MKSDAKWRAMRVGNEEGVYMEISLNLLEAEMIFRVWRWI